MLGLVLLWFRFCPIRWLRILVRLKGAREVDATTSDGG